MDLNFSLDRAGSEADVDSMIRTFTEAILEARAAAVPLVFLPAKNGWRRVWQNSRNTQHRLEFE
jgi:hypothetical protein